MRVSFKPQHSPQSNTIVALALFSGCAVRLVKREERERTVAASALDGLSENGVSESCWRAS
ncbi:hypothetical protein FA15DRAFT_674379 [Coprinopsis marcescibilis]|uniref:Uncharacterized protein n=1 Tax=Coprinopsis marcescibilis TaxID=230819 RepID=A0A5C3KHJ8_COPMA|nr:hypothetical protein FA15DRAFT_674379 [Coprinopsis marcescibilis]